MAYRFFALFLFSLAYVNLWYSFHFMGIHKIGSIPLTALFYPYEFLLGVGFYFYIKSQEKSEVPLYKKEFYWFIPALIYMLLNLYFYAISIQDSGNHIYLELERSGFYIVIEYIRFIFNIILGFLAIRFLNKKKVPSGLSTKDNRRLHWLFLFARVFIAYNLLSLLLTIITFLLDLTSILALNLFYLTFLLNTVFIYWIGYVGFTKYSMVLSNIGLNAPSHDQKRKQFIEKKLTKAMEVEELFTQMDFSLSKLAMVTKISQKELSDHINTIHKCNVSEFINIHRVKKVKTLIDDPDFDHYTLEAISYEAGFKSKSSFHSIFKKHTGITPSQYKKRN